MNMLCKMQTILQKSFILAIVMEDLVVQNRMMTVVYVMAQVLYMNV